MLQTIQGYSQFNHKITNSRGDTITFTWPFPIDSLCEKSEVIISFKPEALKLNNLCWTFLQTDPTNMFSNFNTLSEYYSFLYSQQLQVDSIIADSNLSKAIKLFGGVYFNRLSTASPCRDTISLTRYGDTILNRTYLTLLLKLNNETNILNLCGVLNYYFLNLINFAQPNFCAKNNATPIDINYNRYQFSQDGYFPEYLDVEKAWDYQTGTPEIKVAVIDCGIDYTHCDLGGNDDLVNYKVPKEYRFNFVKDITKNPPETDHTINTIYDCKHGTMMAGIIAAYTNRYNTISGTNCSSQTGVAGIAGGWFDDTKMIDNYGCTIVGLKAGRGSSHNNVKYLTSNVYKAIIAAAQGTVSNLLNQAYGAHIINMSLGFDEEEIICDLALEQAINYAFENGVNIVASRGNGWGDKANYPACFEPRWITNVGALNANHRREERWGKNMDFLAPADLSATTSIPIVPGEPPFEIARQTSSATAHVSGCMALLKSEFLNNHRFQNIKPETIDIENIIKVASEDLNYKRNANDENSYTGVGYDIYTGWGEVKIGKVFEMLASGYELIHLEFSDSLYYTDYQISDDRIKIHQSLHPNHSTLPYGEYWFERRMVTGKIELDDLWERSPENPLFAWGRNGRSDIGGVSLSNNLFLSGYTEIISGISDGNGNGLADNLNQNTVHINERGKLEIVAKTYQLKLYEHSINDTGFNNQHFVCEYPPNQNIKFYISIFAKPKGNSIFSNNNCEFLYPKPAHDFVTIMVPENIDNEFEIIIFDLLGNEIFKNNFFRSENESNNIRVNLRDFKHGLYYICLKSPVENKFYKVLISR